MKRFLIILGTIFIIYGLGVNAMVSGSAWFNWIFCIAGLILILLAFAWKWIKKLPKALKAVLVLVFILCLANFAVAETRIIKTANSIPDKDAKWVIILGAKVNNSGVSLEFARRIDAACDYAKENTDCIIVTTGGKGKDEPEAEGLAALNRLLNQGIYADRIIAESKSDSTRENFLFAKALMEERGYKEGDKVIIVSSAFHLYRAGKIAHASGFDDIGYLGVTGKAYLLPQYYFREYAALLFESLKGVY